MCINKLYTLTSTFKSKLIREHLKKINSNRIIEDAGNDDTIIVFLFLDIIRAKDVIPPRHADDSLQNKKTCTSF